MEIVQWTKVLYSGKGSFRKPAFRKLYFEECKEPCVELKGSLLKVLYGTINTNKEPIFKSVST